MVLRYVLPVWLAICLCVSLTSIQAQQPSAPNPQSPAQGTEPAQGSLPQPANPIDYAVPSGTVLRVELAHPLSVAHLHPGSLLEGELFEPVFVYDREVIPAHSPVHAVVEGVAKERIQGQKKGVMDRLETMRSLGLDRKYAYQVTLRSATVTVPNSPPHEVRLRFVEGGEVVELHAKNDEIRVGETTASTLAKSAPGVGRVESARHGKEKLHELRHPMMTLEVEEAIPFELPPAAPVVARDTSAGPVILPAGTHARLLLLDTLSAAGSKAGDSFTARLEQPIFSGNHLLLPEGTVFGGKVRKVVPPRRLSRPGSVYIAFDTLNLPDGSSQKIAASLTGTGLEKKAGASMDTEGGLHGGSRGPKQTLKDLGMAVVAQQAADEAVELAVHAAAPYAGVATGLFFFLGGRGHDVTLPKYSELQVAFSRPVTLPEQSAPAASLPPLEKP